MTETECRNKFMAAAERQGWKDAQGVVCALSGGGDSVALLWLMKKYFKGRIVAAHLDHCTRAGESHKDALFAAELCRKWDVEISIKTADVEKCRLKGESFEMAGRRLRYLHFEETAGKLCLPFIALGHNADDVVETQLLNLTRGCGISGMRGIPERRGNIVRPVIDFTRGELREILLRENIAWCDDFTNDENNYKRNKIRNILIPWIKENLNENFESVMLGLSAQVRAEMAEREKKIAEILSEISYSEPPAIAAWKTNGLKKISETLLAGAVRMQGAALSLPALSRERTETLCSLIRRGGCWRFQWASDVEVCYSERGIGWLHRADVIAAKERKKNNSKIILPWWAKL
ncbi:MAG: tRNA lysidine(34) synthetase TilS [Synergistes sp.]|nr:tRNA lysidine(34) synthetase TilS [Synergistes sp.]